SRMLSFGCILSTSAMTHTAHGRFKCAMRAPPIRPSRPWGRPNIRISTRRPILIGGQRAPFCNSPPPASLLQGATVLGRIVLERVRERHRPVIARRLTRCALGRKECATRAHEDRPRLPFAQQKRNERAAAHPNTDEDRGWPCASAW